jgi:hypothetical protein
MWHFSIAQSQALCSTAGGGEETDVVAVFFIFDAHFVGGFFATSAELARSKITPGAGGGIDAGCVLLGAAKLSLGERLEMELVAARIRGDKKLPTRDDTVGDLDTLPASRNRVGWHRSSPG